MPNHNPRSREFVPREPKPLPRIAWDETPNQSARIGKRPYLIVIHRPVGMYRPSINWLKNPASDASAHVITEGKGTGVDVATQLVPWDRKAWSCSAFNSFSYNIEADDDAWDGDDPGAFFTAAHIAAFICHKTNIPALWTKDPLHKPGITRHLDLGIAGGGHSDPTSNSLLFKNFIEQTRFDLNHTSWRATWGKGKFVKI
jgi:N-acetyl-anhydromuramyl-L-alanine amidase AmpD